MPPKRDPKKPSGKSGGRSGNIGAMVSMTMSNIIQLFCILNRPSQHEIVRRLAALSGLQILTEPEGVTGTGIPVQPARLGDSQMVNTAKISHVPIWDRPGMCDLACAKRHKARTRTQRNDAEGRIDSKMLSVSSAALSRASVRGIPLSDAVATILEAEQQSIDAVKALWPRDVVAEGSLLHPQAEAESMVVEENPRTDESDRPDKSRVVALQSVPVRDHPSSVPVLSKKRLRTISRKEVGGVVNGEIGNTYITRCKFQMEPTVGSLPTLTGLSEKNLDEIFGPDGPSVAVTPVVLNRLAQSFGGRSKSPEAYLLKRYACLRKDGFVVLLDVPLTWSDDCQTSSEDDEDDDEASRKKRKRAGQTP